MSKARDWLPQVPLQTSSALLVIAMDWITFAVNVQLWLHGHPLETALFAGITAVAVGIIEVRAAPEHRRVAALKTAVAGLAVAAPLPFWGSGLGLASLIGTLVQRLRLHEGRHRETRPRVLD